MTVKVFEWECPEPNCKKVIHSIYQKQFDYNKKKHIESHRYMERKKPLKPDILKKVFDKDVKVEAYK